MENTENTATAYTVDHLTARRVEWSRDRINAARWHADSMKRALKRMRLFRDVIGDESTISGEQLKELFLLIESAAPALYALERSFTELDRVDDILLGYANVKDIDGADIDEE